MSEPTGADFTGPQMGLIATVIMGIGAFAARGVTAMAKAWLSKDERIDKLHDDKLKLVLQEWKEDREIVKKRKPLYANSDMNRRKDSPN